MIPPAGYSGTPLARKLGMEPGRTVALLRAPPGFEALLEGLPADVRPARDPRGKGPFDVVVLFAPDRKRLEERLPRGLALMDVDGALWVAWPKKASPLFRDLTEDGIRELALPLGVVDTKVCAVDAVWSGLRLVVRRENRPSRRSR